MMKKDIKDYLKSIEFPKYRIFDYDFSSTNGRVDLITFANDRFTFINFLNIDKPLAEEIKSLKRCSEDYIKLKGIFGSIEYGFIIKDNDGYIFIDKPFDSYLRNKY